MHSGESRWWYQARTFGIRRVLKYFKAHDERICDVGAGYGAMCPTLKAFGHTTAFEPDEIIRKQCEGNCDAVFGSGDLSELVKRDGGRFTLVTLLDVVEHVENDHEFLQQVEKLLSPGGHVLVTVPAYMALWSELDVDNKHFRRYNKKQIVDVLKKAGFEITYASYWNMMIAIPAFVVRRGAGKGGYAILKMPRWLDYIFLTWVRLETYFMPRVSLPFGTSIFVYARKLSDIR